MPLMSKRKGLSFTIVVVQVVSLESSLCLYLPVYEKVYRCSSIASISKMVYCLSVVPCIQSKVPRSFAGLMIGVVDDLIAVITADM